MRGSGKFVSTALVAAGLTVALVSGGLAQDATPTSMTGGMEDSDTLAAHIHAGACGEAMGEPVAELAELQLPDWVGAIESGESDSAVDFAAFGIAPVPVAVSTSEVPLGIADIVSGGHSITAEREDPADPEDDVACGSIGGVVDENGDLFVGLAEMNDSGHSGVAWLHDTGASTTVVVFVAHPDQQEAIASALADMEASGAAATPVETTTGGAMATPEAGSATPTA
jgi:hypothetical protein